MTNERHEHDVPACIRSTEPLGALSAWVRPFDWQGFSSRLPRAPLCEDPAVAVGAARDDLAGDPALGGAVAGYPAAQAPAVRPHDLAPLTELGASALLLVLALVLGLLSSGAGCAPSLAVHERMALLVHAAVRACKEDGRVCDSAIHCARSARDAGKAIQDARRAAAEGREDADATARSLALPRAAEEACKRAGLQIEKPR